MKNRSRMPLICSPNVLRQFIFVPARHRLACGVATRYDRLSANYLGFVQFALIRLWLRLYEYAS
jgi:transposase